MNTYLGGGVTGAAGYCPPHLLVWDMKIEMKIVIYTFLASKNLKPTKTLCKYVKKNKFITTLHYKCHKDQQISEYMREVGTIGL